jgi:hypothetical protein
MEWADGIGAARKRQGLAPQSLQRSVCNDSKSLVKQSKQAIWKCEEQAVHATNTEWPGNASRARVIARSQVVEGQVF